MNLGSSNRLRYDNCNYEKKLYESTSPLAYRMYAGHGEHCDKCIEGHYWMRYNTEIIDTESELMNLTRPLSNCDQLKYSPTCKKSAMCLNTFDKSAPIILAPEVCPIVYNNIPRQICTGIHLPNPNFCKY